MKNLIKLLLIGLVVMSFSRCSAVKRSQHKSTTDLAVKEQKGIDTSSNTVQKSFTITEGQGMQGEGYNKDVTREIVVDFPVRPPINSNTQDYTDTITVSPEGIIKIQGSPKKIRYRETDKSRSVDTSKNYKKIQESVVINTDQKGIDTSKAENSLRTEVTESNKKKIGSPAGVWIPIALGGLAILIVAWRFGFLRRRKNDDDKAGSLKNMTYSPPTPPES